MRPDAKTVVRGLIALISAGLLLTILWIGGFFAGFVVLSTDHSDPYVGEWTRMWITGALLGALTALLAGWYDRRYWLWIGPLALVGVGAASMEELAYGEVPLTALGPLLAASLLMHAWLGRDSAPSRFTAGHLWIGGVATLSAGLIFGAASVYIVVRSQPTPAYEAMQADPMADDLPGMVLNNDSSSDRSTFFRKPSPAEVSRTWTITDGSPRREKLTELRALAARHGWVVSEEPYCAWQKTADGHPLCLEISKSFKPTFVLVEIRLRSG